MTSILGIDATATARLLRTGVRTDGFSGFDAACTFWFLLNPRSAWLRMADLNVVVTPGFWALPEPWTAVSWSVMRRRSGLRLSVFRREQPGPAPRAVLRLSESPPAGVIREDDRGTGGWRRGGLRQAAWSGTPEFCPQLEELRSGHRERHRHWWWCPPAWPCAACSSPVLAAFTT